MIDLHTHILPGVDDGVKTEDEAVEFARLAVEDGIDTIVATPHCKEGFFVNDRATVVECVARLRTRFAAERLTVKLLPGAEVHIGPDLVERVRDGRAPTLGDNGRTLLLELSLTQYPLGLDQLVFQLKLAGIEVLFAHPERIRYFQDDPQRFAEMIHLGAWGQITTGSILGQFGSEAGEFSEELLRKGLVHVIASDAHNTRGRKPSMSAGVEVASKWIGERRAIAMANAGPAALLAGEAPQLPPVDDRAANRGSFLSRLFRR